MIKEKKQVESFKHQLDLAQRVQEIRNEYAHRTSRHLSRISNAKYMNMLLKKQSILEVKVGKETSGIVIKQEMLESLLEYVELLEEQVEQNSDRAMVENRKGDEGFVSGNILVGSALNLFDQNEETIRSFLDDDK